MQIASLDISSNRLGVEGGRVLGAALLTNTTLTTLNLRNNFLGVWGARAIIDMLDKNRTIRRLK